MNRADELVEIEKFLANRGATHCPPADGDAIMLSPKPDPKERRRAFMTGSSRWGMGRKRGSRPDLRPRIREELMKDPGRSNRAIAAIVGCCGMTVARVRQTL